VRNNDRRGKRAFAKIKRQLMLASAVAVGVTSLGFFMAYLWGDARIFDAIRFALVDETPPPGPRAHTPSAPKAVKGCRYCATLNELHQSFAAKALAAEEGRTDVVRAIKDAGDGPSRAAKQKELAAVEDLAERWRTAADTLAGYVAACEGERHCKAPPAAPAKQCPQSEADAAAQGPALGLASVARELAVACVAAQCPAVHCEQAAVLRQDLLDVGQALSVLGNPVSAPAKAGPAPADVPVGPATLASELSQIIKDVDYLAKRYPSLLEPVRAGAQPAAATQGAAMMNDMLSKLAEKMRGSAEVMTQAAIVTPVAIDARREAAWRTKSLSLSVAEAALLSSPDAANGPDGKSVRARLTQAWGAALVDLAAIVALNERLKRDAPAAAGCDGALAVAGQAVREAAALMDLCRARSACAVGGSAPAQFDGTPAGARAMLWELIPRAQASASVLTANVGPPPNPAQVSTEAGQATAILGAGGACPAQ
jgi:hypothetical protein